MKPLRVENDPRMFPAKDQVKCRKGLLSTAKSWGLKTGRKVKRVTNP